MKCHFGTPYILLRTKICKIPEVGVIVGKGLQTPSRYCVKIYNLCARQFSVESDQCFASFDAGDPSMMRSV